MASNIKKVTETLRAGRGTVRRRVTAAAVATATAAALLLGSLFATPAELLGQDVPPPAAIVEVQTADDGGETPEEEAAEPERKRGARAALSRFFRGLPTPVRLLLLCPLWLVGKAALLLLTGLFSALGGLLPGLLLDLALLTGLFLLAYRLLFPDRSVKSFFRRRNVLSLAAAACLLTGADALLPLWWEDWEAWSILARILLGTGTVCGLWYLLFGRRKRGKKEKSPGKQGALS